jgi:hypothetical protein
MDEHDLQIIPYFVHFMLQSKSNTQLYRSARAPRLLNLFSYIPSINYILTYL